MFELARDIADTLWSLIWQASGWKPGAELKTRIETWTPIVTFAAGSVAIFNFFVRAPRTARKKAEAERIRNDEIKKQGIDLVEIKAMVASMAAVQGIDRSPATEQQQAATVAAIADASVAARGGNTRMAEALRLLKTGNFAAATPLFRAEAEQQEATMGQAA